MKNDDPIRHLGIIVHEVARLLRRNFDRRVSALGLTQAQWRTLFYLSRNEGVNQASLADLLEVKPITLARLIDRLEEAGWVERRRDPADRRVSRLYLTEAAQPLLVEMEGLAAETRKDALGELSHKEQAQALDLLTVLKMNLMAAEEKAADNDEVKNHE